MLDMNVIVGTVTLTYRLQGFSADVVLSTIVYLDIPVLNTGS